MVALAVALVVGLVAPSTASAATAGPRFAGSGSVVDGPGTRTWNSPGNITAGDGSAAVTAILNAGNSTSEYLRGENFGLNIPAGSTITGISVDVRRWGDVAIRDSEIRLAKGSTIVGVNKATATQWPTAAAVATYGGPSDLWGTTWTSAEINAPTFGVVLSATRQTGSVTASVDYIAVTVTYTPPTYTLTYAAGTGGTISGTSPQTVAHGGSGTSVMAVPDTGYRFTGWSDGVTTATRTDTNVTADLSVTANFAPLTYTLTYTAGTGGTISGTSPQTVEHGGSGTAVMAVANTGYDFVRWSDGVTTAMRTDTLVMADIDVTAIFAIKTYTLTYTAGTGGTISGTSPQTVAYGGSGTAVMAVPDTGYRFTGWSDGVTTATRTDTNVTADRSVTAIFAPLTHTLTYTAGTGGTISGTSPQTVAFGESGTAVTAVASSGYRFTGWSDGVTTASRTDTNVTADLSVTASFAPLTYTLTYTAGTGGTISGTSPQTVAFGESGTAVTAVASSGYRFTGWSDGVTTATRTDTNVTADLSVTASFAPLTYTLTYSAGPGGTISGTSPQTVAHGGSGTAVMAVPNAGFYFAGWSDLVTTATRTDTNVTANRSVTAIFAPLTHTLTYTAGTGGTISGTSPQTVAHGGSGTPVTAVPDAGYRFTGWSDGVTTATRTETNVTGGRSFTAHFAPEGVTYPLVYPFDGGQAAFTAVYSAGGISVTRLEPRYPAPPGYRLLSGSYFEIVANHSFTGPVTVTIAYQPAQLEGAVESELRLLHRTDSGWEDITESVDFVNKTVTGTTRSFSDFAVAAPAVLPPPPTSAVSASPAWSLILLTLIGIAVMVRGRRATGFRGGV
jgi:uncharacterized cupredoxin-like copper-binding protein